MDTLIVVPARWASSRFPGKPLAPIAGRPMLERVAAVVRVAVAGRDGVAVTVATDDVRIADFVRALGVDATMTPASLSSGSSRCLAAARTLQRPPRWVLNVQGDAPFVPVAAIAGVLDALRDGAAVATPVVNLGWSALDALREQKRITPFSGTTCVRRSDGDALWFSKAILPAVRDEEGLRQRSNRSPVFQHIGLYGYTLVALSRFEEMGEGRYEALESLEQLRFLEAGMPIRTVEVEWSPTIMSGIDSPEDVVRAERLIALHGDPLAAR